MTKTSRGSAKRSSVQVLHSSNDGGNGVASDAQALQHVRELLFGEASSEHRVELAEVADELHTGLTALDADFRAEMAALRAELREEMRGEVESLRQLMSDLERIKLSRKDLGSLLTGVADQLETDVG